MAKSSGEVEFYAEIKGVAESLGLQSLLLDLGITVTVEVITDSSAAMGTASRIGIGKIKHLDVGWLWIQDLVKQGRVVLRNINGKVNPADLLTKPKSAAEAVRLSASVGYGLIIRNWKDDNFCGLLSRAIRGDSRTLEERSETMDWWYSNMRWRW